MLHFGRYQESVHTHLYLKLSITKSGVKFRKEIFQFLQHYGNARIICRCFFESRGYYAHILVSENKMTSITNLCQLSKYKEEVIWVVK